MQKCKLIIIAAMLFCGSLFAGHPNGKPWVVRVKIENGKAVDFRAFPEGCELNCVTPLTSSWQPAWIGPGWEWEKGKYEVTTLNTHPILVERAEWEQEKADALAIEVAEREQREAEIAAEKAALLEVRQGRIAGESIAQLKSLLETARSKLQVAESVITGQAGKIDALESEVASLKTSDTQFLQKPDAPSKVLMDAVRADVNVEDFSKLEATINAHRLLLLHFARELR